VRILIVKPSSLGDVVHALPTVNRIRQHYPKAHIAWLINDIFASLLEDNPLVNEVIQFPREKFGALSNAPSFFRFLKTLRQRNFDLVLDLQGLFRSGLITWTTGAAQRVGLSDSREGSRFFYTEVVTVTPKHAVDRYLLASDHLGCTDQSVVFPITSSASDKAHIDGLIGQTRKLIAINPSSRWKTKLWGLENFSDLIKRLPQDRVVLTGAPNEAAAIQQITQGATNTAGKTNLRQLAELYRRCAVLITNDSGPMHVAAAVGTPVIAVFGPTDPKLTGPYGKKNVILRSNISCSPCLSSVCKHLP